VSRNGIRAATGNEANHEDAPWPRVAEEVLELGEALFDAAIEAAAARPAGGGDGDAFPAEEMRAAAGEFFAALRVLLETQGGS
jgi:hypothetical protein